MADGRTLVETEEYTAQLDALADEYSVEVLESALMGLLWGVATNPHKYEKVTGNIYQAKSRSFDALRPSLKLLFSIESADKVILLWVEEIDSIDALVDE